MEELIAVLERVARHFDEERETKYLLFLCNFYEGAVVSWRECMAARANAQRALDAGHLEIVGQDMRLTDEGERFLSTPPTTNAVRQMVESFKAAPAEDM